MYPPQSFDPEKVNKISFKIEPLISIGEIIAHTIVEIDNAVRYTIELTIQIASIHFTQVQQLSAAKEEKRDFKAVEQSLQQEIDSFIRKSVNEYRSELAQSESYMEDGREIQLTPKVQEGLVATFQSKMHEHIQEFKAKYAISGTSDLAALRQNLQEILTLQDSQKASKASQKEIYSTQLLGILREQIKMGQLRQAALITAPTDIWRACELGACAHLRKMVEGNTSLWPGKMGKKEYVNQRDLKGFAPLDYAVYLRQVNNDLHEAPLVGELQKLEVVRYLLECGANPRAAANPKDKEDKGYQPLHWAAKAGLVVIARELIECDKGADIDCEGEYKRTPLHMAVYNKKMAVTEFLLKKGAFINAQCSDKEAQITPLFYAILQENIPMLLLLLKHKGINVCIANSEKFSPLSLAIAQGNTEIAQLIHAHENWRSPTDPDHPDNLYKLIPLLAQVHPEKYQAIKDWLINAFWINTTQTHFPNPKYGVPRNQTFLKEAESNSPFLPTSPIEFKAGLRTSGEIPRKEVVNLVSDTSLLPFNTALRDQLIALGSLIDSVNTKNGIIELYQELASLRIKHPEKQYEESISCLGGLFAAKFNAIDHNYLPSGLRFQGNFIQGHYNQFSLQKCNGTAWPKDSSRSSCALNVLEFINTIFSKEFFNQLSVVSLNLSTNRVNWILDAGRKRFEEIIRLRKERAAQLMAEIEHQETPAVVQDFKLDLSGDAINLGELDEFSFPSNLFLDNSLRLDTTQLLSDEGKNTTVALFDRLLVQFENDLKNRNELQVGYAITCNGSTYGLALIKNDLESLSFAIFDSHGAAHVNQGRSVAFIYWTELRQDAANFLGNLIAYHHHQLKGLGFSEKHVQEFTRDLNKLGIYRFLPKHQNLEPSDEDMEPI